MKLKVLSEAQIKRIVGAAIINDDIDYAVGWMIMFYTGCRVRECYEIHCEDIDYEELVIMLRETKRNVPRSVPIPDSLLEILQIYARGRYKGRLLKTTLKYDSYARVSLSKIKKYARRVGINGYNDIKNHTLRHSYASIVANENPILAKETLGHSNIRYTDIYTHLTTKQKRKRVNECFNPSSS